MPKRASAKNLPKKKKQGRQPAAKLARDWSPLSRMLKVPPRQKRFRQTRRSTSAITLPLLPAGDGDDERRKIQAPRGANYHIEICLTLHEDNVGHEVHARKHNDSHTRQSGGPETPRTRNVVPDSRKEGENMCVGNDNNNKKSNCPNRQELSQTIVRDLSDRVRMRNDSERVTFSGAGNRFSDAHPGGKLKFEKNK